MERLSQNPYPLRFVKANETLSFQVAKNLTSKVAGASLEELQTSGSLFVVEHKSPDVDTEASG